VNRHSHPAHDEGAIVLGWLTKVVITLAVLGFLSYDGISIVSANISAADRANTLASEGADDVRSMRDVNKAYAVISAEAAQNGDTIEPQDFRVASDGHVTLELRREASSLWMSRIAPLRKLLHVHATGEGSPAS
jgi:hypothetical protein